MPDTPITAPMESAEKDDSTDEFYRHLVEQSPDPIFRISLVTGRFSFVSPALEALTGYRPEEILADQEIIDRMIHPDWREFIHRVKTRAMTTGRIDPCFEYRIVDRRGQTRWIHQTSVLERDPQGRPLALTATLRDISVRKDAELALRRSEERFRQLADNLDRIFWINSPDLTRVIYSSPAFERIYGVPVAEIEADPSIWLSMVHPDDMAAMRAAVKRSVDEPGNAPTTMEYRIRNRRGQLRWLSVSFFPVLDDAGNCCRIAGITADVTDQKEALGALQESEARFRRLVENLDHEFWIVSPDRRRVIYLSPALERIWGIPRERVHADPMAFMACVPAEDRPVVEMFQEVTRQPDFRGPLEVEHRIVRPDGQRRWIQVRCFALLDEGGRVSQLAGLTQDITAKKEARLAIEESEARFRLIAENIDEMFWIADPQRRRNHYVSPAFETIWGRPLTDVDPDGKIFHEAIHPDDQTFAREVQRRRDAGDGENPDACEYRIVRPDGQVRWVQDRCYRITDAAGNCTRTVGVVRDITDRRQVEAQLRARETLFRQITETMGEVFWVAEPDRSRYHYVSPAYERVCGRRIEEVYRDPASFLNSVHPADQDQVMAWQRQRRDGTCTFPHEIEYRILQPDGRITWLNSRCYEHRNADGRITHLGVISDITTRKNAELSLAETETRFHTFMEHFPGFALIKDAGRRFVYVNRYTREAFQQKDWIGRHTSDIYAPETAARILAGDDEVLANGPMSFTNTVAGADGFSQVCRTTKFPIPQADGPPLIGAVGIDISRQKQIEEELRRARDDLEKTVEERTTELRRVNRQLRQEIKNLRAAEDKLRRQEREIKSKSTNLLDANVALKVLLRRRHEDRQEVEQNLVSNVKELVEPYLRKLAQAGLPEYEHTLLSILESNLRDIASPFVRELSSSYFKLTPAEIQVANLIKQGRTTKEMARMLHLSPRTVESHRDSIRRKLGLKNKRGNLRTYLMSMGS